MDFKKGDKIIYPFYGVSIIKKIVSEEINGEQVKYFELSFVDSQLTVLVPVLLAGKLGLRYPLAKKELAKTLKFLGKATAVSEEELLDLEDYSNNKLRTGITKDTIEVINVIRKIVKEKSLIAKKISIMEAENLKRAQTFLQSEVAYVMGKNSLEKYKLGVPAS